MLAILIFGTGVGVVLGLRFSVFALVSAILFAPAAIIITGLVSRYDARAVGFFTLAVWHCSNSVTSSVGFSPNISANEQKRGVSPGRHVSIINF